MNTTHHLVLPEDLNQYGHLFGGRLLSWVDEASWIAASLDFPECQFVTIGMNKVEFRHAIQEGAILTILSELLNQGKTSVTYSVNVYRGKVTQSESLFSTDITFVNVDAEGVKKLIA